MSGWVLERDGQILLTQDDRCNEDQNGPVSFLVGTCLGDVEGPEPDGRDFVFVFSDGTRLYIFPDDGPYESYVFKAPKWFVEVFGPATGECVDPAA
jgi:hypothetical protein